MTNEHITQKRLQHTVKETVPDSPLLNCPNCSCHNIEYEFIGDAQNKKGYFLIWCNDCLEGLHISRIEITKQARIIPLGGPSELNRTFSKGKSIKLTPKKP